MPNSSQRDFNLLLDHTYAKILIILGIDTDLFKREYDKIL